MKKLIIMAALLFASTFASASRFPASIQELEKDYTKRNIASVLTKHHTALDIVSKDLVEKHLKVFKKTKRPSHADFNALEEDLKHFLKANALVKSESTKDKVEVHSTVMNVFSDSQKKEVARFVEDFNSNIFPPLYTAVITKNKKAVVSNLQKWKTINKKYSQFLRACLKKYQKMQS